MNPTPPSLDAIKDALFELSELDEPARGERLAQMAVESPALVHALQALLPGAMATVDAAQSPARALNDMLNNPAHSGLPQRLGNWRVLREIGRGGMGVVLLGERADGAFDKQVAIKVLPPVLAGPDGARRLAAEAQALARLEHPHIARLLDAGVDQGCAYMVMEHVQGQPITTYVNEARLGVRQRLALLLQLCSAVQFAHGQLLVHRDIKPNNVLVDAAGQVRLLDFGIAKVLLADDATAALHATAQAAFTPAYASPEQLLGQPAGVAGDVFSLGVLLFELLTGQHPFLPKSVTAATSDGSAAKPAAHSTASALAVMRAVIDNPPDTSALRQAGVPADLQAVVLKALEKPLAQRYASVEALAGELQAFLAGLPVKAQAPNWRYRATKFVQRNRWPVLAAALASTAVLSLTTWALYSAEQARQQQALAQTRLQTVRAIANKVVFDYNRALEPVPGTLELRKTLVADALTYLDAMSADAQGDQALQADIAAGYEAVGDVQGRGVTGGNLGDLPAAQRSYQRAEALRRPLCEGAAVSTSPITSTAAIAPTAAASGVAPIAKAVDNSAAAACGAWAATLVRLGDNAFTQRRTDEAIAFFDSTRAAAQRALAVPLLPSDPRRQAALDLRSQANQRLAGLSLRQTGAAYDRGLVLAQDQLQAAQALAAEVPGVKSQETLRVAQDFMGVRLLSEGQPQLALPHIEQAVSLARAQQTQRNARDAGVTLATSLVRQAEIHAHLLQPERAAPLLQEALGLVKGLHAAEPEDRHLRARYANVGWRVGEVNHLIGNAAALQANGQLLPDVLAAASVFKPEDGVFFVQRQRVQQELARNALRSGNAAQSLQSLESFPSTLPPNPAAAADLAEVFLLRAEALRALDQTPAALQAFDVGFAAIKAASARTPGNVQLACRLMQVQRWAQSWAQAEPSVAAAYANLAEPVQSAVAALQTGGKLSPYWAQALAIAP